MADQKLAHAREFTDIENLTLDLWLELEDAGLEDLARTLLDAGLMFEHYTSLLASDPAARTQAEISQQAQLGFHLSDQVRLSQAALNEKQRGGAEKTERRAALAVRTFRGIVGGRENIPGTEGEQANG